MNIVPLSEERNIAAALVSRVATQGHAVSVDPDLAAAMGAFTDDALSDIEADDSRLLAVSGDDLGVAK